VAAYLSRGRVGVQEILFLFLSFYSGKKTVKVCNASPDVNHKKNKRTLKETQLDS